MSDIDKEKLWKEGLDKIQEKHIDFFKSRKSPLIRNEHDTIEMHLIYHGNRVAITKSSDLPKHIKDEINELMQSIFS